MSKLKDKVTDICAQTPKIKLAKVVIVVVVTILMIDAKLLIITAVFQVDEHFNVKKYVRQTKTDFLFFNKLVFAFSNLF